MVGLTEHPLLDGKRIAIAINYSPAAVEEMLTLKRPWAVAKTLHGGKPGRSGENLNLTIPANDAVVLLIAKGSV